MNETPRECALALWTLGARRHELSSTQRAHAESCAHCARELDDLERLVGRVRGEGPDPFDPARSERLRARLLDSARRTPQAAPSRGPKIAVAIGLAAVVALGVWVARGVGFVASAVEDGATAGAPGADPGASARGGPDHGTVRASAGAHFTRVSDPPDEIVRLVGGAITVSVTPLGADERFRVVVGDAEVEVRGTAFDVAAENDRLTSVHVFHGRVEVRVEGAEPVLLEAGDRWTRPADEASTALRDESERVIDDGLATAGRSSRARRRRHARAADESPAVAATELATPGAHEAWSASTGFEAGWNALSAGDPATAASAWGEVVERAPADPLAEDASFWRGVALARAGRATDAREALDAFVRDYPSSLRANEASVMLGWLLVSTAEADRARAMFSRGVDDSSPRVRASAERGLAAIDGEPTAPPTP